MLGKKVERDNIELKDQRMWDDLTDSEQTKFLAILSTSIFRIEILEEVSENAINFYTMSWETVDPICHQVHSLHTYQDF